MEFQWLDSDTGIMWSDGLLVIRNKLGKSIDNGYLDFALDKSVSQALKMSEQTNYAMFLSMCKVLGQRQAALAHLQFGALALSFDSNDAELAFIASGLIGDLLAGMSKALAGMVHSKEEYQEFKR